MNVTKGPEGSEVMSKHHVFCPGPLGPTFIYYRDVKRKNEAKWRKLTFPGFVN